MRTDALALEQIQSSLQCLHRYIAIPRLLAAVERPEKVNVQAHRIGFLQMVHGQLGSEVYLEVLKAILRRGTEPEQIDLLKGLHELPDQESFHPWVIHLVRTNSQDLLAALSLGNPYPSVFFSRAEWNQLVLKLLFWGWDLAELIGLEERMNDELYQMLEDYHRERRLAGRAVPQSLVDLMNYWKENSL